jgi:hypothetical protein
VLDPDLGDPIDLLLVAIDVDIAVAAGMADPPRNVGPYETKRLRATVESWLMAGTRGKAPNAVVVSTPAMAIEAWIIAAIFRKERSPENITNPAAFLVDKGRLRESPRDGKPWKELRLYRDFAPIVARRLKQVRKGCAEAERTALAVERCRTSRDAEE